MSIATRNHLSRSVCARTACVLEVTARKPGNVHPGREFEDLTVRDFIASATAAAPVFDDAPRHGVGSTVLEGVRRTRRVVGTNTNLGIVLLLAPLAAVPDGMSLREGLESVLGGLNVDDAADVYEAIRLARPGGLGRVADQDVSQPPTETLRQVMQRAAGRDLVARQYANGFQEVFGTGLPALVAALDSGFPAEQAIIACHLRLMAAHPDTLIARKRGPAEAEESAHRAQVVLDTGWPRTVEGQAAIAQLDGWLRGVGHARNPGTTADLVTACLFVALREGRMQ